MDRKQGPPVIKTAYFIIVAYFTAAFLVYFFREQKIWAKVSTVLVLIIFLLRLLLIK